MEFIEWNNKTMSIGIKLIDDQHKALLKIINQLSTTINENSQRSCIVIIIDELIDYSAYHFTTEEKLFDKFDYDESHNHKKEHDLFVKKFIEIKSKIPNEDFYLMRSAIEIADDVFKYIIDWFLDHVVGSDRKYVELFKKNSIK